MNVDFALNYPFSEINKRKWVRLSGVESHAVLEQLQKFVGRLKLNSRHQKRPDCKHLPTFPGFARSLFHSFSSLFLFFSFPFFFFSISSLYIFRFHILFLFCFPFCFFSSSIPVLSLLLFCLLTIGERVRI